MKDEISMNDVAATPKKRAKDDIGYDDVRTPQSDGKKKKKKRRKKRRSGSADSSGENISAREGSMSDSKKRFNQIRNESPRGLKEKDLGRGESKTIKKYGKFKTFKPDRSPELTVGPKTWECGSKQRVGTHLSSSRNQFRGLKEPTSEKLSQSVVLSNTPKKSKLLGKPIPESDKQFFAETKRKNSPKDNLSIRSRTSSGELAPNKKEEDCLPIKSYFQMIGRPNLSKKEKSNFSKKDRIAFEVAFSRKKQHEARLVVSDLDLEIRDLVVNADSKELRKKSVKYKVSDMNSISCVLLQPKQRSASFTIIIFEPKEKYPSIFAKETLFSYFGVLVDNEDLRRSKFKANKMINSIMKQNHQQQHTEMVGLYLKQKLNDLLVKGSNANPVEKFLRSDFHNFLEQREGKEKRIVKADHRYSTRARVVEIKRHHIEPEDQGKVMFVYPFEDYNSKVSVYKRDLSRTEEETFLNDTVIDFYLKYLVHDAMREFAPSKDRNYIYDKVYTFNSLFYKRMFDAQRSEKSKRRSNQSENNPKRRIETAIYQVVQRWAKNVDLFSRQIWLAPVNDSLHWSLVIVLNADQFVPLVKQQMEMRDATSSTSSPNGAFEPSSPEPISPLSPKPSTPRGKTVSNRASSPKDSKSDNGSPKTRVPANRSEPSQTQDEVYMNDPSSSRSSPQSDGGEETVVNLLEEGGVIEGGGGKVLYAGKHTTFSDNDEESENDSQMEEKNSSTENVEKEVSNGKSDTAKSESDDQKLTSGKLASESASPTEASTPNSPSGKEEEDGPKESSASERSQFSKINYNDSKYELDKSRLPIIITMDSLEAHSPQRIAKTTRLYIKQSLKDRLDPAVPESVIEKVVQHTNFHNASVPRQHNSFDCGVFVCAFAKELLQLWLQGKISMEDPSGSIKNAFSKMRVRPSEFRENLGKIMLRLEKEYARIMSSTASENKPKSTEIVDDDDDEVVIMDS